MEALFARIGCDPRPIRDMLGGDVGVTNKNIMVYMGLIEHRTTELLNMLHYVRLKVTISSMCIDYKISLFFGILFALILLLYFSG